MDVFQEYKPLRNQIALLSVEGSLAVIWAYGQFLQVDEFRFPPEIEVANDYLRMDFPQQWIAEWELELLAKEVILNAGLVATKGRPLRTWKTLSTLVNALKALENRIAGAFGSPKNVLVELIRIAHRQFIWQGNPPNSASIIRYYKIFNRPRIDDICRQRFGLSVWEIYMCGIACMGSFLDRPALRIPYQTDIKALSIEAFEKFLAFTSKPIAELKRQLKTQQQYNESFAYAYSSLRAFPLVRMSYQGSDSLVCPLMTLLYWRFTSGLYYELVSVPEFSNEFGDGFQTYVGDVLKATCGATLQSSGEQEYTVGKARKRSIDWIAYDGGAALFLECKSKRLSLGAKVSLTDLDPLRGDIESMAAAVVQVYRSTADYLANAYPHFRFKKGRKIFPAVVTLENWRMFGPVMMDTLSQTVAAQLEKAGLSATMVEEMQYSIWAVEELEVGLQVMSSVGITGFMEGKLSSAEMQQWDWHGYMTKSYPQLLPAKKLFEEEHDAMFSNLHAAQQGQLKS